MYTRKINIVYVTKNVSKRVTSGVVEKLIYIQSGQVDREWHTYS